ncbi:MAG: L-serine ammonia-lyase, iron-sulfur-dependent, subunit alpha [Bacilli bacterium]|nr:L-serine ammonia-lyase, iron-sulfur-dependent, subunit alpha [Bacilli bacterium]
MNSIKDIYKIGHGPSSSHTMGPAKASQIFKSRYPDADFISVELFGSLALTGKGHLTDKAIINEILPTKVEVKFNFDIVYEYHSNAMKFLAYKDNIQIGEWLVFSIGGGELRELNEEIISDGKKVYPVSTMGEVLKECEEKNLSLVDYCLQYEDSDLRDFLKVVLAQMEETTKKGITTTEEVLPGKLKLRRKAKDFYAKYKETNDTDILSFAVALATAEENAAGGIVVTAPTCGSCGVLPGTILPELYYGRSTEEELVDSLIVAGLIGNIVKTNASISGAEVGCQGEIGVACSMACGALAYLKKATNVQIECAAEIGLEHHLGMTCDPVYGLVQIPCIERNAMCSEYARKAVKYAMITDGTHTVTLDSVIEVMHETGKDMHTKYKETSTGGLALRNIEE